MIIAIDVGGTKTLVAVCKKDGIVVQQTRFETPKTYKEFITSVTNSLKTLPTKDCTITAIAAPGKVDHKNGSVIAFGNLPWKNVPLAKDIVAITNTKVLIDNDANLAGLSEAHQLKPVPHRVLYLTISTGIGTGIITDGYIDPDFIDSEGGSMLFEHEGKLTSWEKLASGKAIVAKYGKRASDINDPKIWKEIAKMFAIGIVNLTSVLEPDAIIIGGGVGSHFAKYDTFLKDYITKLTPPLVSTPPIFAAKDAEEAVIYGCITLANQHEQH